MKKLLLVLAVLCGSAYAQAAGVSISFASPSTSTCQAPAVGSTVLCASKTDVTISFDGAAFVSVKGAKGDTGATGPAGPAGATGATGPAGPAFKPTNASCTIKVSGASLSDTIPVLLTCQ